MLENIYASEGGARPPDRACLRQQADTSQLL
jgi:hypothetical protein